MSYGYLIVSKEPIPELPKLRRYKFFPIKCCDEFFVYSRLEESNELTIRRGEKSFLTVNGEKFFASIPRPFFLMDYLLTKNQGEIDLANIARSNIQSSCFRILHIVAGEELYLNRLYKVPHD